MHYCSHNPNSADFLGKLMIEANAGKVNRAIEKAALYADKGEYIPELLPEVREKNMCLTGKQGERTLLFV